MEQHPTITDIAREMKKPASTLRSWVDRYGEWIATTDDGSNTRYLPEGVEALAMIAEMRGRHNSPEQIEAALTAAYSRTIDAQQRDATAQQQGVTVLTGAIRQAVAEAQTEQMQLLRGEVARLRGELAAQNKAAAERDAELRALLNERLPASNTGAWERLKRRLGMI